MQRLGLTEPVTGVFTCGVHALQHAPDQPGAPSQPAPPREEVPPLHMPFARSPRCRYLMLIYQDQLVRQEGVCVCGGVLLPPSLPFTLSVSSSFAVFRFSFTMARWMYLGLPQA